VKAPPSSSRIWKLVNARSGLNVRVFRLSRGRLWNNWKGAPVLLVHHVGAKSGTPRVSPVVYLADGDRHIVVASKGGTDKHPAWYHNLVATPDTEMELGDGRRPVRARVVDAAEREELWPRLVELNPDYDVYQEQAGSRVIPVISLDPR
jgi:deazaflavin-dependent oxidoreductase (nitroreductase family)